MIDYAVAVGFVKVAKSGRTSPIILTCEHEEDEQLELFCKLSESCEEGVIHLAREAIAACLAADLGLPIPKPYLVKLESDFVSSLKDDKTRNRILKSSSICFGSTKAPSQFYLWTRGDVISKQMLQAAASIFIFDGIIQNPDRRDMNPNCLKKGNDIRVIDHELCFATRLLLNWTPPWQVGGMANFLTPGNHIFFRFLKGSDIDFEKISAAWKTLSDERIDSYVAAIPEEWSESQADVDGALALIKQSRDNIDECIFEARRVLE